MTHYDWLLSRLDAFTRKYYVNQLLRGGLILLTCLLLFVLTVSLSEYFLYLPAWLRTGIAGFFISAGAAALFFWIILPAMKIARLGKVISREQAAVIVGKHFPEISDKLLNILQLKAGTDHASSRELILASIDQKAAQLSVVPITRAVDLKKNRRYLPYLLPLMLIGLFILVAAPNVFRDASERLLQPTKEFERPAPFQFKITNPELKTPRNSDFELGVMMTGAALPEEVFVVLGSDRLPMQSGARHGFKYVFKNVTEQVSFRFFAAGFYSQPYTLQVIQKPELKSFKIGIDYPDYTGRKDELRTSLGDLTLPVGTVVSWGILTDHTDAATLSWKGGATVSLLHQGALYGCQHRFMADTGYTISLTNKQSKISADFSYNVTVIPDQFPTIQLQEFKDTVTGTKAVITGTAGDDYQVSRVLFHYSVLDEKNKTLASKAIPLAAGGGAITPFQYYFDLESLDLKPGEKVNYFVEAWDNDGVHGSKASRSEVMSYQAFSNNQIDSAMQQNAEQINSGLSNSAQQNKQIQQQLQQMQSKMLESDEVNFESKQNVEQLMEQQKQLQSKMEATKKRFEEQLKNSEQKQYSDDVHDKQDELKKQMDNLLNKELAEQMKKLEELMKKLNKEDAFKTAQQLEQENKLFNMDMERMQELMKQLEMQMRMEDLANKMDQLAQKQDDLKKQTEQGAKDNNALKQDQQALKQALDKAMKEDMKDLKELSNKSEQPQNLTKPEEQGENAQQNMQQSQQQLGSGDKSGASKSQSKASQNLQDMANQLRAQAGGMSAEQIDMDIRAVRQILTNLMRLSFDQEGLMKKVRATPAGSPQYLANQTEQNRLRSNSRMVRDSLFVLSKRLAKLNATVNKETTELEGNMGRAVTALEARNVGDALTRQQYVMTHTNNLALMLNEILSNLLQMQMQSQSSGAGSCSKPGGMKPKPGSTGKAGNAGQQLSDVITGQQELGNAMQQAMKQGNKPGQGEKPGEQGKQGGKSGQGSGKNGSGSGESGENGDAETIARLANQQAAVRRQLQELQSLLNSKGLGNAKELREIQDKMDRNESDLVNRRFNAEFLNRQQDILTHLLQAEKSLREQEQDDKRSSKSGENVSRTMPAELQQYLQDRQKLMEFYRTVPPQLKPYYKAMVEQYYRSINTK